MVPPDSLRISRVRRYSGAHWLVLAFAYGGFTLFAASFQKLLLAATIPYVSPTTPPQKPGTVWAIPRSLAATHGVSFDFLSYGYLDVSVPRVGFPFGMTWIPCRVSPFGHSRIVVCLPTPRDFSQAPTSFIASCCQGIPHVPFVALIRQLRSMMFTSPIARSRGKPVASSTRIDTSSTLSLYAI
jgi:hypothetical protein